MMQNVFRNLTGKVRPVMLGGIALLAISTGVVGVFMGKGRQGTATLAMAATMSEGPESALIEASLWEIGCDPATLATLGVTSSTDVTSILQHTSDWLVQNEFDFGRLRQAFAVQRGNLSIIRRDLRRGSGIYSTDDLRLAQSDLATSRVALQTIVNDLQDSALSDLSDNNLIKMERIATLRKWDLDPEQQIVDCTEEDRLVITRCRRLEDAERTDDDRAIWSRITGDSAYITASASRQVNEDAVQATWDRFLNGI